MSTNVFVHSHNVKIFSDSLLQDDKYHSYILLSFNTLTLVLRVTDSIEEQTSTQFITDRPTLHAACLVDDCHLQVTEDGWRLLQPTKETRRISEWKAPLGKRVVAAASNESQVLLALTGGYLVYFEFQLMGNRTLVETGTHDLGHDVTSISIQPTSPDAISSSFAVNHTNIALKSDTYSHPIYFRCSVC